MRASAYRWAAAAGLPAAWRRFSPAATVLCYHNVVPDSLENALGDGALHLGASRLASHLDWLATAFAVVPLSEIVDRMLAGKRLDGMAALTFDDAYAGVLHHALPALRARGLPATLFVVSRASLCPEPFWWDRLGLEGRLDDGTRRRGRDELRGSATAVAAAYPPRAGMTVPAELLPATFAELRQAGGADLTFGSHTRTHCNLVTLSPASLTDELSGSREDLAKELGTAPDLLSYPYGCTNADVRQSARQAGYRAGIALSYGRVTAKSDPFHVIRVNVPAALGTDTLACWASGIRWNPPR